MTFSGDLYHTAESKTGQKYQVTTSIFRDGSYRKALSDIIVAAATGDKSNLGFGHCHNELFLVRQRNDANAVTVKGTLAEATDTD